MSIDIMTLTASKNYTDKQIEKVSIGSGSKLSDFENDLFYKKRIAVATLTQDDFSSENAMSIPVATIPRIEGKLTFENLYFTLEYTGSNGNGVLTESDIFGTATVEELGSGTLITYEGDGLALAISNGIDFNSLMTGDFIETSECQIAVVGASSWTFQLCECDTKQISVELIDGVKPTVVYDLGRKSFLEWARPEYIEEITILYGKGYGVQFKNCAIVRYDNYGAGSPAYHNARLLGVSSPDGWQESGHFLIAFEDDIVGFSLHCSSINKKNTLRKHFSIGAADGVLIFSPFTYTNDEPLYYLDIVNGTLKAVKSFEGQRHEYTWDGEPE